MYREEWIVLMWIIGIFLIVVGGIIGVSYIHSKYRCENFEQMTGKATEYKFMDTCYINHDNQWYRYEEYSNILIAKEGLQGN